MCTCDGRVCEIDKYINKYTYIKHDVNIVLLICQDEILRWNATINNSAYKNIYYLFFFVGTIFVNRCFMATTLTFLNVYRFF